MKALAQLDSSFTFPNPENSWDSPNGLLAIGGDLNPERVIAAYQQGIFPWYEQDQPIMWWSPDPRMVLFPEELHVSRSLQKAIQRSSLRISYNQAFNEVIESCAIRANEEGTWITNEMIDAYQQLHLLGHAQSVEAWQADELVAGLYGIKVNNVFCGESMFTRQANASKIAFVAYVKKLKQEGCRLIDCQIASKHLASFGAREISREEFLSFLPLNNNNTLV